MKQLPGVALAFSRVDGIPLRNGVRVTREYSKRYSIEVENRDTSCNDTGRLQYQTSSLSLLQSKDHQRTRKRGGGRTSPLPRLRP